MFDNIIKWSSGNFFISSPFSCEHIPGNLKPIKTGNSSGFSGRSAKSRNKMVWINNPHYCLGTADLEKLIAGRKPVFISCCSREIARGLAQKNFETIRVGKEAILNLNNDHFINTRLKESIRSGLRRGSMKEYSYCRETAARLEEFKSECMHGSEPQLKKFFNDKFTPFNRLFIFEEADGGWKGGLMLTEAGNKIIKTDLLLRKKDAPNGTMEALIFETFSRLKEEGFEIWSLGEVPYVVYDSVSFSKEYWINYLGRKTKFAYNYSGLFKFKNKFNPEWNDIFICTKRGLNLYLLLKILIESNLIILLIYKALLVLSRLNI